MDCPICRRDLAFIDDCRLLPCKSSCILCSDCLKDHLDVIQIKIKTYFVCPSCENRVKMSAIEMNLFKRVNIDRISSVKLQQLIYSEKKRILEKKSQEIEKIRKKAFQLNALIAKRQIYLLQEINKLYNEKITECERGKGLYEKNMEISINKKGCLPDEILLTIDYDYEKCGGCKLPEFFAETSSILLGKIDEFDDEKPIHSKFTELIKPYEVISSDDCCYLKTSLNILKISNCIEVEFSSMIVKYPVS